MLDRLARRGLLVPLFLLGAPLGAQVRTAPLLPRGLPNLAVGALTVPAAPLAAPAALQPLEALAPLPPAGLQGPSLRELPAAQRLRSAEADRASGASPSVPLRAGDAGPSARSPLGSIGRALGGGRAEPASALGGVFDRAAARPGLQALPEERGAFQQEGILYGALASPRREAQLGELSVTYALEGILEDNPRPRQLLLSGIRDRNILAAERESFWLQFSTRLETALGEEGIPGAVVSMARSFMEQAARSDPPPAIRKNAEGLAESLSRPEPLSPEVRTWAQEMGLRPEDRPLLEQLRRRDPGAVSTPARVAAVGAAAEQLRSFGVVPVAGLVSRLLQRPGILDRILSLRRELELREPSVNDDLETDVWYSILSRRMDIRNTGYFGYRRRIEAARELLLEAGLPDPSAEPPALGAFELANRHEPYEVSGVDRGVIAAHRARILDAYDHVSQLRFLEPGVLGAARDEVLGRTWAYLRLMPEFSRKDEQGRPVPIRSKVARGYLDREGPGVSDAAKLQELRAAGKELHVALHVTLEQLSSAYRAGGAAEKALLPAFEELMFRNLMAYQLSDEVARGELGIGQTLEDPAQWEPIQVKQAVDRLTFLYYNKSREFMIYKTGVNAPKRVQAMLDDARREARLEQDKILKNKQAGVEETVRFVPTTGAATLFRGFCGRDCSKSLGPERGRLALRALPRGHLVYLAMAGEKAVGYVHLIEARREGRKVWLVEIVELPERESLTAPLLRALNDEALARGYAGIAAPAHLHPKNEQTDGYVANFTNFPDVLHALKHLPAYARGPAFIPEFEDPAQMAELDRRLGEVPYFSWKLADGSYRLLDFASPD